MRRLALSLFALLCLLPVLALTAQTATVTPGIQPVTPAVPFTMTATPQPIAIPANDARAAICTGSNLDGFLPYFVREGDALDALLTGTQAITPAQAATLNCLDATDALPVGVVVWLPQDALVVRALPAPTSNTPNGTPRVTAFTASAGELLSDSTVTLTWQAEGERAYLYPCPADPAAPCLRPVTARPIALDGTLDVAGFHRAGPMGFRLEVMTGDQTVTRDLTVTITCAQLWLGDVGASPACPEEPARTVFAVFQPFEDGALIWFSDTSQIYMLTADHRLRVYQDAFVEGMPDPTDEAPEGLLTPVRGFGRLWSTLGGPNGLLGWATAPEQGFDAARQAAGRTSYTTYVQGTDGRVYAFTELPGRAVGYWVQVRDAEEPNQP